MAQKKVLILVDQQYQEMEVWYPYYRFSEAGITAYFVGPEAEKSYPSKLGYPAKAHKGMSDVRAQDYDALIIPGGWAPDFMRRHSQMVQLTKDFMLQNKVVGSICHGGWMLCSAKCLEGRMATSFFAIKDDMTNAGAVWKDEAVVVDKNLVTSRTPDDLPAFMKAVISLLS